MRADDLRVRDFFNIGNALFHTQHPVSVGATVSFDFRWLGPPTARGPITSPVTGRWSAKNAQGFRFRSHPSGTTSIFGQLGRVRNGIFSH